MRDINVEVIDQRVLDGDSIVPKNSPQNSKTEYIPMDLSDVHPLLIHHKYKISNNYSSISKLIGRLGEKSEKYQKYYDKLEKAIHSNSNSDQSRLQSVSKLTVFLLECLKHDKKKLLKDDFAEEALIHQNWLNFQKSVADPIYSFQELYFDFIHKEKLENHFGEDLSVVVEEVLRDDVVSENEREYLFEKAEEHCVSHEKMESLLSKYFQTNPALKRLIYEICKDGKITEAETNYLFEKTSQYKISNEKVRAEIESIINKINQIRSLFANDSFFMSVLLLYLVKFLEPSNSVLIGKISHQLNEEVTSPSIDFSLNNFDEIQHHLLELIHISSNKGIPTNEITNIEYIIRYLGANVPPHHAIQNALELEPRKLSTEQLAKVFTKEECVPEPLNNFGSQYKFGSAIFDFNYIEDPNYPLFCYDSLGERVIISVNKSHYFYNDTEIFKIWLISTVINLKKNYENEQLIEEVQHLLNPPATIRLKFPKKDLA